MLEITEEGAEESYTYFELSEIIADSAFFSEYEDYLISVITTD